MFRAAKSTSAPIALGGADVFHLVGDRRMRAENLGSNQCALVVELDGRIDPDKLRRRISQACAREPHFRVTLRAPMLGSPFWAPMTRKTDGFSVVHVHHDNLLELEGFFSRAFTHDDEPWRIALLRGPTRDAIAFVWFHPFTDAKGAQRIMRWLGSGSDDELAPLPNDERTRVRPEALDALDRDARIALAKTYNEHILGFAKRPILSLRGAASDKPVGRMRFERIIFDAAETRALDKSIRQRAKLAESAVMIVSAARVLDQALRRRGFAPTHHMIPVPLSLDPKGESGRLFGNHITMMMFSLERADLGDERRAIASLAEQQRNIVRDKLDLAMSAALELVRVLPPRLYHGLATLPFGGELSSLIFSNPGQIAIDDFAGIAVIDAYAIPSVVPRPGLEVIANRHRGRLSLLLGTFDGLVSQTEARAMAQELRGFLAGDGRPHALI